MPDNFTEITSQSWLGRIGGSIKGLLFGIVMVPISIVVLFWNEGRAVTTANSLKEGAASVISVPADSVSPTNERKLIHLSGEVLAGEVIRDPVFSISATALRIARQPEMYQWKETRSSESKKKLGGGEDTVTRYSYDKTWSAKPIDSSAFKHPEDHTNPGAMRVPAATTLSSKATLGAFKVPGEILAKMKGDEPLMPTQECLTNLPPDWKANAKLSGNGVYLGTDPKAPEVGDVRVTFKVLKPSTFSILAQQTGDSLAPSPTHAGREIERVESGVMSAALMFQHAQDENRILTWALRVGGFVLMAIGFAVMLNPLRVFADVVPFIGSIVGFGTGLLATILAFATSIFIIAIAWLAARPLLSVGLFAVAIGALIYGLLRVRGQRRPAAV